VYEGGTYFRDEYIKKYSSRESHADFYRRREITNIPTLAKSSVNEVKNSIFQRITDVSRIAGPLNYQDAVVGNNEGLGVDLNGNTMNSFVGRILIPELLVIGKVGIFIDKPSIDGAITLSDTVGIAPYMYHYRAEDILAWSHEKYTRKLTSLLLRDHVDAEDPDTGLVTGTNEVFRLCRLTSEGVTVQWFDNEDTEVREPVLLKLPEIPFVIGQIGSSLLKDTSSYQKALLNAASSDMAWILGSNLPFYTEQFDMQAELAGILRGSLSEDGSEDGTAANASKSDTAQAVSGHTQGRRYSKGMERPGFIHPSSEPLQASMKKQEQLKAEIREIINLNVASLLPSRASGESKKQDSKSLEAGLSYIGLELQYTENEIARIWGLYEGDTGAKVTYPDKYSLRSDADVRDEAKEFTEISAKNPSKTFQREVAKHNATITMGSKITTDKLREIHAEIDNAEIVITDPETIRENVEAGLLSRESGSQALGYAEDEVTKANKEHAERAARIAIAQSDAANRGNPDMGDGGSTSGKLEKEGGKDKTDEQ
jgi:hypothetical protein